MRNETIAIHSGYDVDPTTKAVAVPIYQTVAYEFDSAEHGAALFNLEAEGFRYSRISNPTCEVLERRVAALEGGVEALCVSSGQAALNYAVLNVTELGCNLVAVPQLYGTTHTLFAHVLPSQGVSVRFAESDQPDAIEKLIDDKTKAVFCESVGNPAGNICDIAALAGVAHRHGVPLIVDNTVATPYLIQPLSHGADIVVHSATKYLGGHGAAIAGVIVDGGTFDWTNGKFPGFTTPDPSYHGVVFAELGPPAFALKARVQLLRDLGSAAAPFNAFLVAQGLETLSLRVERHVENAQRVAQYLSGHPDVVSVNYAGLPTSPWYELGRKLAPKGTGAVLAFELAGGIDAGKAFVNALTLHSHVANIGDVRSLVIHPASTTHAQLTPDEQLATGVTPGLVRLAVGIEGIDDILADLEQGFAAAKPFSTSAATDPNTAAAF